MKDLIHDYLILTGIITNLFFIGRFINYLFFKI